MRGPAVDVPRGIARGAVRRRGSQYDLIPQTQTRVRSSDLGAIGVSAILEVETRNGAVRRAAKRGLTQRFQTFRVVHAGKRDIKV
eukprot:2902853-Rhodomonas_salina.1